jgi:hypothetical protein
MINRTFVVDVQDRVARTRCPSCDNAQLEFELRCELPYSECLFVARCTRCRLKFDVDADSYLEATKSDSEGHVRCPTCHRKTATLALAWHTASHSRRYVVTCPECDDDALSA